ncbi:hypothetical protein CBL_07137 [Carabus blaptoides fortunei]
MTRAPSGHRIERENKRIAENENKACRRVNTNRARVSTNPDRVNTTTNSDRNSNLLFAQSNTAESMNFAKVQSVCGLREVQVENEEYEKRPVQFRPDERMRS